MIIFIFILKLVNMKMATQLVSFGLSNTYKHMSGTNKAMKKLTTFCKILSL